MNLGATEMNLDIIHLWNNDSLQLLYSHFYKALVGFSMQIVEGQELAEDIVQEVFFNTWKKKNTYQSVGTLKAYLFNSVRNESINHIRRQRVRLEDAERMKREYKEQRTDESLELKLHKEEVYRQLFAAIDKLPPKQREIFLLVMDGKKNTEIAEALSISINTVKKQKQRGMENLRELVKPEILSVLLLIM